MKLLVGILMLAAGLWALWNLTRALRGEGSKGSWYFGALLNGLVVTFDPHSGLAFGLMGALSVLMALLTPITKKPAEPREAPK